jgi:uncharacterized SAM-binding protein YcdF (DUF218 family)
MIHLISKFAPIPIYPIGLCAVFCAIGLYFVIRNRRRRLAITLIALGVGELWLFSLPLTANLLLGPLERSYVPLAQCPAATAVVLLGGAGVGPSAPRIHPETNRFGDRVLEAARLFRQGKAEYLICTGGVLPFVHDSPLSEASNVRRILVDIMGLDSSRILLADRSRNTREDALDVARVIAGLGRPYDIVLVTSAFHMARSVRIFTKQGFTVYPAPGDFEEDTRFQWKVIAFLPDADALERNSLALHEFYGLMAYRLLGWI